MLRAMREKTAGNAAPHNKLYRPENDGVATTFAGFVAAALEIPDPYHASRRQREQIKQAHLLLAAANAMQPGVFSLSSWDLVGALPIPEDTVAERIADGDYRWVNRGGVDLMGANRQATKSAFGIERATALYGSLPEQLSDSGSFASQLRRMLSARKAYRIAEGELVAVLDVEHDAVCILVFRIPGPHLGAITAMNFSRENLQETIDVSKVEPFAQKQLKAGKVVEIVDEVEAAMLQPHGRLTIELPAMTARTLVIDQKN
jgi:trehalose synthase